MRELFDEVAGQSPLDPQEAVRRVRARAAAQALLQGGRRRRGRGRICDHARRQADQDAVGPPGGRCPSRAIADAIAAEWDAQQETIDPLTMPLTRFANSVVDARGRPRRARARRRREIFRVRSAVLPRRPSRRRWSRARPRIGTPCCSGRRTRSARISSSPRASCMCASPTRRSQAARAALPDDPWSVAALHVVTTLTGSALLALALPMARAIPTRSGTPPMSTRTGTATNGAWTRRWPRAAPPARSISAAAVRILRRVEAAVRFNERFTTRPSVLAFCGPMALPINPILPVIAAQAPWQRRRPIVVLQPGTVVDARCSTCSPTIWCGSRSPALDRRDVGGRADAGAESAACGVAERRHGPARGGQGRAPASADQVTLTPTAALAMRRQPDRDCAASLHPRPAIP